MPNIALASDQKVEVKVLGGNVRGTKEIERDGVKYGIVEGYIATWDLDRGDWWGVKDQFVRGAFTNSLNDLRMRKRQIRLKDHHYRTIGGFPIDDVKEDERGLFGIGEINLEVQQGREAYMLAKQGVLSDFSIGFSIEKSTMDEQEDIRTIQEAIVWEGSIVDEPMNPFANITVVKGMAKELSVKFKINEEELKAEIERLRNESFDDGKIDAEKLKTMDGREVEQLLKKTNLFSNKICKFVVTKLIEEGKIDGSNTEREQTTSATNVESQVSGQEGGKGSTKERAQGAEEGDDAGDKGASERARRESEVKRIEQEQKQVTLDALNDLCSTLKQRSD